jgi:hypothetical protein
VASSFNFFKKSWQKNSKKVGEKKVARKKLTENEKVKLIKNK